MSIPRAPFLRQRCTHSFAKSSNTSDLLLLLVRQRSNRLGKLEEEQGAGKPEEHAQALTIDHLNLKGCSPERGTVEFRQKQSRTAEQSSDPEGKNGAPHMDNM